MAGIGPEQFLLNFNRPLALYSVSEIFAALDQELLDKLKEDRRIERKPANAHPKSLEDYFSMWANTKPDGGIIVVGQEDNGSLTGCTQLSSSRLNELERACEVHCPDAKYVSKRVPIRNTKGNQDFILAFHVFYRDDRVVRTVGNDAFVRIGGSKKKLGESEIREMEIDKGQVDYEQELVDMHFPRDFDLNLIGQFAQNVHRNYRLSQQHSDVEVLEHRHLGRQSDGGFRPNVACALLFAKDPTILFPGCKIRFLRFDGEHEGTGEKFNAVKDITVEGCVPQLIVETEQILDGQLRTFSRLGADKKFYTAPEYPKAAWYEAVVNACVHRSYNLKNMNIFVKMFDDRLQIESPGGFPAHVTPENIYEVHHPRNPHLMNAMFHLDYVKAANEGTRRMRDTMKEMSLPLPEFASKTPQDSFPLVKVVLRNDLKHRKIWIDADISALLAERIVGELSQDEKRVLNWIAENNSINVSQVQRLTSRSWPSSSNLLKRLAKKGILSHVHRKDMERDPQACYVLRKGNR